MRLPSLRVFGRPNVLLAIGLACILVALVLASVAVFWSAHHASRACREGRGAVLAFAGAFEQAVKEGENAETTAEDRERARRFFADIRERLDPDRCP